MVHQNQSRRYHRGTLYRNGNRANAVPHVPHRRYTYLPVNIYLLFLWIQVLHYYENPHIAGNTRKNRPTEALYWFLSSPVRRRQGRLYSPRIQWPPMGTRRCLSADRSQPPAAIMEVLPLAQEHSRILDNE